MQMTVDSKAEQGEGGTVAIMDREPVGVTYHLDVVSSGFPITEWMGWSISLTSKSFTLNRQKEVAEAAAGSTANSESSFYGEDNGTRIKGHYAYIMPALYFGGEKSRGFKLGIGVGYGSGWMDGTIELSNSLSRLFIYGAAQDPQLLNTLIAYNITSGLMDPSRLKPEEAYLIATINEPGHLDLLGQYWSATGMAAPSQDRLLPLQQLYPGRTLFELSAIESLGRSNIRRSTASLFAYQVYLDFPSFHNISTRFYVEGPVFSTSNYNFSFQSINIAFYYPIGIGW
jgi:hypothetical protein